MTDRTRTPEQIDGYEVLGRLGEGGVGLVLKARDRGLDRIVAIKLLIDCSDVTEARFAREAKVAASLDHPNIARIHAVGQYESQPYIVMEYVEGRTLEEIVDAEGALPPRRALRVIEQTAIALEAAAGIGLVHRDVKPGNVMIGEDDIVKIVDFGLARPWKTEGDTSITSINQVIGTPDFISPEQAQNLSLDFRSDMYSLGGTLYFALTGLPPFVHDDPITTIVDHIRKDVPDVRALCPRASDELSSFVDRLCQKDPDNRFATYAGLLQEVGRIRDRDLAAADPNRTIKLREQPSMEALARTQNRRVRLLSLLLLAVVAILLYTNVDHLYATETPPGALIVSSMNTLDGRGLPPGWSLDSSAGLVSLAEESEAGQQTTFVRVEVDADGSTSFSYRSRLPEDIGGKALYLSFRARRGSEDVQAEALLQELPGGTIHVPLPIEALGGRLTGHATTRWAVGGSQIREIELSFEISGEPGSTLDIEDVILHYFQ